MAHHGFSGLNAEFYELVDPKAAFFDAPYWLMNGESENNTVGKEELIREMGCEIYSFYTGYCSLRDQ